MNATLTDTSSAPRQSLSVAGLELPVETTAGNYFVSNYPPYSVWSSEHLWKIARVLNSAAPTSPFGLYVHMPFCRNRCHYCYVRSYQRRSNDDVERYIHCLLDEYSMYLRYPLLQGRLLNSVYIGGGTPSYLSALQLTKLLASIQQRSDWSNVEECTVECEPGSLSPEKLLSLKFGGVTRLSISFHSLNDDVLRRNGRDITAAQAIAAYNEAKTAEFDQINVDLLAGLPGETESTWLDTVEQVLQLTPDSITMYQLELAYNSALYASEKCGRALDLATWPAKRKWITRAFQLCEEAGYVIASGYMAVRQPEWSRAFHTIDNFWRGADLVAIGESAFGYLQGVHYQNTDSFERYTTLLSHKTFPWKRGYELNPDEKMRRELVLQLKTGVVDLPYFRQKFEVNLLQQFRTEIQQLIGEQYLDIESRQLRLTREGLLKVDWLVPMFYLSEHRGIRYT